MLLRTGGLPPAQEREHGQRPGETDLGPFAELRQLVARPREEQLARGYVEERRQERRPEDDRRQEQRRSPAEPRRDDRAEARSGEREVERLLHLEDVVQVQLVLRVDRLEAIRRLESDDALPPRELLTESEERQEREQGEQSRLESPPVSGQTVRSSSRKHGHYEIRGDLGPFDHGVLAHQRAVETRMEGGQSQQRPADEGRGDQHGRGSSGNAPPARVAGEPQPNEARGGHLDGT